MLFKKTLKVASATALWMVALLGATSAMAQDELPIYSAETLTGAGPTYAINSATGGGMDTTVKMNDRAAYYLGEATAEDPAYIRVAATGVLRLETMPTVEIVTQVTGVDPVETPAGTGTAVAGTGAGYRYTVNDSTNVPDAPVIAIKVTIDADDNADDAKVTGVGTGGVMVAVYDDQADAHFGEGTPYGSGGSNLVKVASSVTAMAASAAPSVNTASAISRFTAIKGAEAATAPYEIAVGGFNIMVKEGHLDAADGRDLTTVAAEDDTAVGTDDFDAGDDTLWTLTGVNGGTRFHGTGGWAFASGFRFAAAPAKDAGACSGAGPDGSDAGPVEGDGAGIMSSPLSDEDATVDVMGGIKENPWYLCVTISNENDEEIPLGNYFVDVNLAPARTDTRPFPPAGTAGIHVGIIKHDGTTVQIPFVTSYDGYTQRIVIVNRNKVDVGYSLTFRSEGDGMIDGDNPYEGMALADQATVLKVADLVTLTGPTRASATLTVASESIFIDVATTMVNKMDQSTDTVVLD